MNKKACQALKSGSAVAFSVNSYLTFMPKSGIIFLSIMVINRLSFYKISGFSGRLAITGRKAVYCNQTVSWILDKTTKWCYLITSSPEQDLRLTTTESPLSPDKNRITRKVRFTTKLLTSRKWRAETQVSSFPKPRRVQNAFFTSDGISSDEGFGGEPPACLPKGKRTSERSQP